MNTKPTPNVERCKEDVMPTTGFPRPHRCHFKAWKDGYCKIHHPDSVKVREEKQRARYEAERAKSPYVLLQKANERISQLETQVAELREALEGLMALESRGRVMPIGAEWDNARATLERTK